MQPVITSAQAASWDARSETPVTDLMERAGMAVAIGAAELGASYGRRVIVLAGPGNNGGDGYVAAKHLKRRGAAVEVLALAEPKTDASRWARSQAHAARVPISPWRAPKEGPVPDLIVDALFGAGFRGVLGEETLPWTTANVPVVSVDVPSGLDATSGTAEGPTFAADLTVTFAALKVGHLLGIGPECSGRVTIADIGLSPGSFEFALCEESDAPRPTRPRAGHKWSVGSVMLAGGSPGISGALWLAARSALRAGAGAVRMALPGALEAAFSAPELMTLGVGASDRFSEADADTVLQAAGRFDVLVVGPGLGDSQEGFVGSIVERRVGPLLLDADALNAISDPSILTQRTESTVITPHAGEFARITGSEASYASAADLARSTGAVVLLKGSPTFVAGEDLWVVTSGGPELATIGTGDVLAGMVAALWARGLEGEAATRSAAYWHGRAGSHLARRGTVTSEALAEEIRAWAWPE
ncbi:MAG: NAD(P)H-hydrate dehydratase [Acidimicrobiia bacterium]